MSKLFANLAGTHIARNPADWHVGQPLDGGIQPRRDEAIPQVIAPIQERIASGEVKTEQVNNMGAGVTAVAFGMDKLIDELNSQAQQAAGEIAS